MSQESETKKTIKDPVSPEELRQLAEVQARRFELADALLDLEQEKVKLLVQARQLDELKAKTFSKIMTDRGLPPNAPVEIDAKTGEIKLVGGQEPPQTS